MYRLPSFIALVLTFGFSVDVGAQPKKLETHFIVFPVSTELHKQVLFPRYKYFIAMNGNALITKDGQIRAADLDVDDLQDALSGPISKGESVFFEVLYHKQDPNPRASALLEFSMKGLAEFRGLEKPYYHSRTSDEDRWAVALKATKGRVGRFEDDGKEDKLGNQEIAVYPVRTALSRYWAEADCVVAFKLPFSEEFNGKISDENRKAIVSSVNALNLAKKGRISFIIRWKGRSDVSFYDTVGAQLAKDLAFDSHSVVTHP